MAPIKLYSPPKFYAHSPLPHPNHVQTNLDSLTTQSDPHKPRSSQSYNILNQSFSNPHILISHVFTSILIYIYVSKKCFDKLTSYQYNSIAFLGLWTNKRLKDFFQVTNLMHTFFIP